MIDSPDMHQALFNSIKVGLAVEISSAQSLALLAAKAVTRYRPKRQGTTHKFHYDPPGYS
ncbi:MAG: hypothetical protein CM1200mP30_26730 [Pseudomonadota bacterium]|nr:MAG: hypothetical protein CM1200mP30_26730 [Pseudomonadota bacterium]